MTAEFRPYEFSITPWRVTGKLLYYIKPTTTRGGAVIRGGYWASSSFMTKIVLARTANVAISKFTDSVIDEDHPSSGGYYNDSLTVEIFSLKRADSLPQIVV